MNTRRKTVRAANEHALSEMQKVQAKGDGCLGRLVWWQVPSEWRMPCNDVHDVLTRHGLDPITILAAVTPYHVAFMRAVESVRSAVKSLDYTVIEAGKGARGETRMSVAKVQRNGIVNLAQNQEIVTCPRDGTKPFVEVPGATGIADQIYKKTLDLVGVYKRTDLSQGIVKLLKRWSGMMCADGLYFLPPGGEYEVARLKSAIEEMGAGTIGQMVGNVRDAESVESCATSVNRGLEAQLSEFARDAESYANKTDTTRASTIERSIDQARKLKVQAELYRTILGAAVSSVDERVLAIERTLRETLGIVETKT